MVRYMPFLFSPTVRRENAAFFAAMNTPRGFISEFSSLFSPYRRYMIKGGPGTGKSTLMKKLAREAEERGMPVRRFYCSSDSASLDAVVIDPLGVALLDATAPHVTEPALVGVKDFYLDLGQFITPDLQKEQKAIERLTKEKQNAYERAYQLLNALYSTDRALDRLRISAFDSDKCDKAIERFVDRLGLQKEKEPTVTATPISALGREGYVALDGYRSLIRTEVEITDRYGVAPLVFDGLCRRLEKNGISYRYSLSPLTMQTDTLLILQKGILITALPLCESPALHINCERFLTNRGQGLYKKERAVVNAEKLLFAETQKAFAEAASAHRELEALYGGAVNFTALNGFTSALIREIFSR